MLVLAWVAQIHAQALTPRQAVAQAAVAHPAVTQARISLRRAQVDLRAEETLLVPQLRVESSWISNDEPTAGLFEAGIRKSDVYLADVGVSWRLPWGTDLTLQTDATWFKAVQPFEFGGVRQLQTIGPHWQQHLNLGLRQPLLKGFGKDVNLAGERVAAERRDAAAAQLQQTASAAILEVLVALFELAYVDRDLAIKLRQLGFAREQREATVALVESGTLAPIEIDVIDQRIVVLQEGLLLTRNDRRSRAKNLGRLLGIPVDEIDVEISDATPAPVNELVEAAYRGNPELVGTTERIEAQRWVIAARDDAILPALDITASVGQNALDPSFSGAAGQILGLDATRWVIGTVFTMPLDNERAHRQAESERLELDRLKAELGATRERVRMDIERAHGLVEVHDERLALTQRAADLSRRTLEAEQARFRAGRSTNQQVLEYEDSLERAELRHERARIDRQLSLLQLQHLSGLLLRDWGLEVGP
jgi:outer membrane protein TolC